MSITSQKMENVEELKGVLRTRIEYWPVTGKLEFLRYGTQAKYRKTELKQRKLLKNREIRIMIKGINIEISKWIWLYVYGRFPRGPVYYKNGDYSDLRLDNLFEFDKTVQNIDQQFVQSLFIYDPEDGNLLNRVPIYGRKVGHSNETLSRKGYKGIRLLGRFYFSHRLVWMYTHGYWPIQIDHINHNKLDNRLENLRNVVNKENLRNLNHIKSATGFLGVRELNSGKFEARIKVDGVDISLGRFDSIDDAIRERDKANRNYNFHFNHGEN